MCPQLNFLCCGELACPSASVKVVVGSVFSRKPHSLLSPHSFSSLHLLSDWFIRSLFGLSGGGSRCTDVLDVVAAAAASAVLLLL